MNTPIGYKLFQDIPRRVAKFREKLAQNIEKSVDGKNFSPKMGCHVRFPNFPTLGNAGLKVSIRGPNINKNWGFSPLKFVRGHV